VGSHPSKFHFKQGGSWYSQQYIVWHLIGTTGIPQARLGTKPQKSCERNKKHHTKQPTLFLKACKMECGRPSRALLGHPWSL
jgi:hypothetical protein